MNDNQFVTANELSHRLGITKSSIYRMMRQGKIPSVPVGGKLGGRRFDEAQVREALAKIPYVPRPYHPRKGKRAVAVAEVVA